jgi:hypothetical protein
LVVVGLDRTTAVLAVEVQNRETPFLLAANSGEIAGMRSPGGVVAVLALAVEASQNYRREMVIQKAIAHLAGLSEIMP